ncbi:MAG TPA: GyrI-like domain-containing protein [Bacteroidia bacterium]|nr:GyrI-like domain-containing protein [Bacteroidia bacterium]
MNVEIVVFPATRMAAIEHRGSPVLEYDTVRKLVAWKLEQGLLDPTKHRHYGMHYADPRSAAPSEYRAEFCLSIDWEVGANAYGIYEKVIPSCRCALARDIGSRSNNQAATHLFEAWLPASDEVWTGEPAIFHYVNVGPNVKEYEAITDVYLPLK